MLEGFQIIDNDWRYLYVNETVSNQGKLEKNNLIGKTMQEAYPGIDTTPLFSKLKGVMVGKESVNFENEFEFPDGSKGWFQLYVQPWENGIMILSVDITDRKNLEMKLNKKIEDLDRIMEDVTSRETRMLELKTTIAQLKEHATSLESKVIS